GVYLGITLELQASHSSGPNREPRFPGGLSNLGEN
ncbi:hypothetical protein Z043-122998, partial [Arapaima gigas]